MHSLAYPDLGVKDRKAVTFLHYPAATSNGAKANGFPTSPSRSPSPIGSPTTIPATKPSPFSDPAPHRLATMQLQKLVSIRSHRGSHDPSRSTMEGGGPGRNGRFSLSSYAQSSAIIDSDPVDGEVLMSLVVELGLE
ncbi:cbp/p300-interacting transactivator 1-like [Meriones unguiculatus]|uniref:cbp/p300-interacting transactivator 1-like n=1 Tax=Meriones unguiculatus TaxID=10047 RepID=UPI000B4EE287|nr:cbp/p300-interacting transactivator 1-like [Meriones unguiculatus]